MAGQQSDPSRRKIMRAAAGVATAALCFRIVRAAASDKMTRQQAEYQDMPNGIYSCGLCTLFEPPAGCKVVEGEVGKDGWCKAFALAD
ncbi:hypothetical protein [Afipia sp. GAS231]|uniref:hypothetical protein n=1 Tax=Afipia sp. GAS231 TaxID=1882747 RepID=UPI00087C0AFF|nr:hypothetical protein [Afipia sp. GAS231]SDO93248.1 hypothetical protein SAMN05444050_5382 [Afipia sp. GAS231]